MSVFRNAFVIVVLTIASWLYCRHRGHNGKYPIKILQTVPRGFQHVGPPVIDSNLVSALASELPVATIILLLEHIAISKCEYFFLHQGSVPSKLNFGITSFRTGERLQD